MTPHSICKHLFLFEKQNQRNDIKQQRIPNKASIVLLLFHKTAMTMINAKNERIRSGIIATFAICICKEFFNITTPSVVNRSFFLKSLAQVETK
jgi:hypothetical protein